MPGPEANSKTRGQPLTFDAATPHGGAGRPSNVKGQRITIVALVINSALAFVKLMAGLVGHSSALIADAVESFVDILSSVVVWHGLNIAARPADEDHPYGHGRADTLAAFVVALMVVGAGLGVAIEAIREIVSPQRAPSSFTLGVLPGVVLIKETLFRIMRGVAHDTTSPAVLNDAWHQRSDAITSAAAAIGIGIAVLGGPAYAPADDWAALAVSAVILYNGYRLSRAPVRELMDTHPPGVVQRAENLAAGVPQVMAVEKVFARKSGTRYLVDMHIEVDPEMSVRVAHTIAHQVKEVIQAAMPSVQDVLIHIEPFGGPGGAAVTAAEGSRPTTSEGV